MSEFYDFNLIRGMRETMEGKMRYTCDLQRDRSTGRDSHNRPVAANFETMNERPQKCLFEFGAGSNVRTGPVQGIQQMSEADAKILLPYGTDFNDKDRVVNVTDPYGQPLYPNVAYWEVTRIRRYFTHLSASLKAYYNADS